MGLPIALTDLVEVEAKTKLEIMRDSRIGSFGVLALIFLMSTRIVSLSNLPAHREILLAIIPLAMTMLVMVFYLLCCPQLEMKD